MLSIQEIKKQYDAGLHMFDRGLLREYLQYQILSVIFKNKIGQKLSFLGGTCLRIVHNLPRFSEDLDFDNKNLSGDEFTQLSMHIESELEKLGYLVEIREINRKAFYCYIKFPDLLYSEGLSPVKSEKILIQVDTFDQGVDYESEIFILDKFNLFDQIRVTPRSVMLSQKLWTITQRKRLKGRDFFDIMFLLQNTKPDIGFLKAKFGTTKISDVKNSILNFLQDVDFKSLAEDVRPFLLNQKDAEKIKVFTDFLKQSNFGS